LGVAQWALLGGAALVVQHAAHVGVRCAAVILPDDPAHYAGAAQGNLVDGLHRRGPLGRALSRAADAVGVDSSRDGARMLDVRRCVHARMTAIVPSDATTRLLFGGPEHESLASALGEDGIARILHAPLYLAATVAVTFPKAPGELELHEREVPLDGDLVLRVSALVPCLVPMVSSLMCPRYRGPIDRLFMSATDPERTAISDLAHAPLASLQTLLALRGPRMAVLHAEARMPAQSASYAYFEENEP
jgi:hypothetical protein